jgi:serine phosphatase RsbU (regulator of sigma subunit)
MPAGRLGRATPLPLEALHVLDEIPPHLVAEQLVAEARRVAGVPVALYVIDIDGSALLRLAGEEGELPDRLEVPLGLGQEIAPDSLEDLYAHLEAELPGCLPAPLWLRGRATGILLAVGTPRAPLTEIARQGAAALELSNRYTDSFEAVRRSRATSPAAEMQLNLVPCARIVRVGGGELAGGILASPKVGGDWFDFSENRDGTWLAIADAAGDGPVAAGRAAVSLGALRSARRRGLGLAGAASVIQETVHELGEAFTVDAVLARWQPPVSTFSWIACGHPPPLLARVDGEVEPLGGEDPEPPLGVGASGREFRPRERRLRAGERVILCSDGVLERRDRGGGAFGEAGVGRAIAAARGGSAAATARAILHAAVGAADGPLEDDAVVVVFAAG